MIVDAARDTVMAKGHALTRDNPLMHAVMVGIDLVARSQGGGMWDMQGTFAACRFSYIIAGHQFVKCCILPKTWCYIQSV